MLSKAGIFFWVGNIKGVKKVVYHFYSIIVINFTKNKYTIQEYANVHLFCMFSCEEGYAFFFLHKFKWNIKFSKKC